MNETRELFRDGPLVVTGRAESDGGQDDSLLPDWGEDDGPEVAEEMRLRLAEGDFEYVDLTAEVVWDGTVIGGGRCGRVEHGQVTSERFLDAWQQDGPLADVVGTALGNARQWAKDHGSPAMRAALDRAAWPGGSAPEKSIEESRS